MPGDKTAEGTESARVRIPGVTWDYPAMTGGSNQNELGQVWAAFQDMHKSLGDMQTNIQEMQTKLQTVHQEFLKRAIADWHESFVPSGLNLDLMNPYFGVPDITTDPQAAPLGAAQPQKAEAASEAAHVSEAASEAAHVSENAAAPEVAALAAVSGQAQRLVDMDTVIRGGSYFVGATAIMSLIATTVSGAVIIQPAFSVVLLILAIGFYCMTLVKQ